ncbi:NRDE protein-domain-containing protein [Mycena latifolia]|nr:NRDE protein-domain-containing protein [Mycena latifolia]
MCVAFWTLEHPDYALILCANRDEYLARPTLAAAFRSFGAEEPAGDGRGRVLSGLDAQAGGTWLGLVPAAGRVALLTNITEPAQTIPSSRGDLVSAFLLADAQTSLDALYPPAGQYAGFNLLVLAAEREPRTPGADAASRVHFPNATLLTNGGARGPIRTRVLSPAERENGGLSNGVDGAGADAWPKVVQGRALFAEAVASVPALGPSCSPDPDSGDQDAAAEAQDTLLAARLFALLRTTAREPIRAREDLRRTVCVAPLPVGEGSNKAMYATRLATVLLVRRSGAARFAERDVWVRADAEEGGVRLVEPGVGERLFRVKVRAEPPGEGVGLGAV